MAKVFLSYDRDDTERARPVALALEKAGHFVWWDLHIRGGEQFSKKIDEALQAADAVVVLWSKYSVESAWVRDEAAAGRDSGRLIPVSLDDTKPPLGFRQYQTIDLSRWRGRGKPIELKSLFADVEAIARSTSITSDAGPDLRLPTVASPGRSVPWRSMAAAAAVLLVLAAIVFWAKLWPNPSAPTVTVASADSSRESRELADDLMIKLARLQSATAHMRLIDPGSKDAERADLKFEVRHRAGSNGASLALLSEKDRMVLWSNDFEVADGNRGNLRLQLSYTAARLLGCATEALPAQGPRLSQELLRPYLNGCAILGERYAHDVSQAIPLFLLVTQKAPRFEPAWAKLLLSETDRYIAAPAEETRQIAAQMREHIEQARRHNPNLVETFLAEAELAPGDAFSERARLIERALEVNPDHVFALSARAGFLQDIGRMNGAVDDTRRAAQLDPLSPALRNFHISALAYAGRMPAAEAALAEAERLWPGATTLIDARYRLALRYGDPAEALRLQDSGAVQSGGRLRESFLQARMNPTPANIENAVAVAWAIFRRNPIAVGELAQTLGEFNREEELFPVLVNWSRKDEIPFIADVLFRPPLKELWHDPRFMQVGKAMGMLDYWRANDVWPEFCADPDLPYDCKKVAAKLR